MPLVRIAVPAGKPDEYVQSICNGVHEAMVAKISIPAADRFQIVTEHTPARIQIDPTYLGVVRTPEAVIINITMKSGRTPEIKRALYQAVVQNLVAKPGLRKEDIMIVLQENEATDWSFGNGEAQIAPASATT